jgi:hypothetical protein
MFERQHVLPEGGWTSKLIQMLSSSNAQLEFLTLLGIILNGLMQGYVTANTVYVCFIENIERKLRIACGVGEEHNQKRYFKIHAERIHNTIEHLTYYKRKKIKIQC